MSGSLKILEKLKKEENESVKEFIKDLIDFEKENPTSRKPFRAIYKEKINFYLQRDDYNED